MIQQAVFPGLKDSVPYTVAVIQLDGAPDVNVVGNIVNRPHESVAIGQRVRAVFETVPATDDREALSIPQWEILD